MSQHYCSTCRNITEHLTVGETGEWRSDPSISVPSAAGDGLVWDFERIWTCGECGTTSTGRTAQPAGTLLPVS